MHYLSWLDSVDHPLSCLLLHTVLRSCSRCIVDVADEVDFDVDIEAGFHVDIDRSSWFM